MRTWTLSIVLALCASAPLAGGGPRQKTVVAYPWLFDHGTETARQTATNSLAEIIKKNGYGQVSRSEAEKAYKALGLPMLKPIGGPTNAQLAKFGERTGADYVVFGSIGWHTRSIWVGAGPKTISTATVDASVLDVGTAKIVYSKQDVWARSDEKENAAKVAGAVLLTPLVTAVSGGPQTPREQRSVQIALARVFEDWNRTKGK